MISAVDTNVLLDVTLDDPVHADRSQKLLENAYQSGSLIICDLVYAELAPQFDSKAALVAMLATLNIRVVESGLEVAFLAGVKWAEYRRAGGNRTRLITEFLIGAHAQLHAECLLTRDRGFYKAYFPELRLLDGA